MTAKNILKNRNDINVIKEFRIPYTKGGRKAYRYMAVFRCNNKGCGQEFTGRIERIHVMTGLCRACANKKAGKTRSTHGHNNKNSRLHITWANMKRRCLNPTEKEKKNYGESIPLYGEWHEYVPFMVWAKENGYSDNLTIDRIDGSKGYTPENCRFVDYSTQSANRKIGTKNKTGYIGVSLWNGKYAARVQWRKKQVPLGVFADKEEAAIVRDLYVISNKLPHTLNFKGACQDILLSKLSAIRSKRN